MLINFGVSHNGIITFLHGQPHNVAKIGLYPWTQIGKISYESKTLKVHAHTPDVIYFKFYTLIDYITKKIFFLN